MGTTVVIEGIMASELSEAWRQLAALSGLTRLIDSGYSSYSV